MQSKTLELDAIRVGVFEHPVDGWRLDVTSARLDSWVGAFRRMREAGVPVPFTKDHRQGSDAALGQVVDMRRDGDRLVARVEVRGRQAIELAERVQHVSVEIEDFVDGEGRAYGEAITAISLTPSPIVSGQRPARVAAALKIAASLRRVDGGDDAGVDEEMRQMVRGEWTPRL